MAEISKKVTLILFTAVIILVIFWLTYLIFGQRLIKSIYYGHSLGFFNKFISRQNTFGLDYYLHKAHQFMVYNSLLFLLTVVFSLPFLHILLSWKEKVIVISPRTLYFVISLILFIWLSWSALFSPLVTHGFNFDFWEHTAALKEWSAHLWNPRNPHLAVETPSPRYIPSFFLLAIIIKVFHLSPITAMGISAVLNAGLLLIGIYLFFKSYFKDNWSPVVGLMILFCGWGTGWIWTNLYQLRSLFFVISYPSTFVFALTFYSLWLCLKILRQQSVSLKAYAWLGVLVFLMFISNPPTAIFSIASIFVITLTEPKCSFNLRAKIIAAIGTGIIFVELWPFFSMHKLFLGFLSEGVRWPRPEIRFYRPNELLLTLGPSLLGIPLILYLFLKRKHLFISFGFLIMLYPYILGIFTHIPHAFRFILYTVFYLHLALVWGVIQLQSNDQSTSGVLSAKILPQVVSILVALFIGWNLTITALEFMGFHQGFSLKPPIRYVLRKPVVTEMKNISSFLPDKAVVLAPLNVSWALPTFSGKVMATLHINPLVSDGSQRYKDNQKFFSNQISNKERINILNHYKITHIIYQKSRPPHGLISLLDKIGRPAGSTDDYCIIQIYNSNKFTRSKRIGFK